MRADKDPPREGPAPPADAPEWRRDPYRLFFPLGALLGWAGVMHWLLHSIGTLGDYRPVFHAITQIQGFMMSFAAGFLFTAVPRRTGTPAPAAWQMAVALAAPVATTVAAWFERWALSQIFWFAMVLVLAEFALRRFLSSRAARRPPNSFVWVPVALAMGTAGSGMIAVAGMRGDAYFWLHDLGKLFLLQGMFIGLVLGLGGMVLPLLTRGDAPPDAAGGAHDRRARAAHLAAAVLLGASFWIENAVSQRGGLALRAAVVLAVLLASGRIARPPSLPGRHRRLVWIAAWMMPLGYLLAAAFPLQAKAGLHVVFIGSFALMALSVGLHVTLAHGGYRTLVGARLRSVSLLGALMLASVLSRALVDFDRPRFFVWIGLAAGSFLAATAAWGWVVVPRLLRAPRPDEAGP